jgi:uncharacterized protein YbaR (Trm112 family)
MRLTEPNRTHIVDPYVQAHVARTNGRLYRPLVNALRRYPIPNWPFGAVPLGSQISLDVGCGWGRWMVSAAQAGYLPVGMDVQVGRLAAAKRLLKQYGLHGYVVAADLRSLPFRDDLFDSAFSYSTLQHANRQKCLQCIREISRVLRPGGSCCLEFPITHGLANWRYQLRRVEDDPESWDVRYYSRKALRQLFSDIYEHVSVEPDCFLGIGVRAEDLDLLPWKYKAVVITSEGLKAIAKMLPLIEWFSDSVFVRGRKPISGRVEPAAHSSPFGPEHNLWILPWLVCPATNRPLRYEKRTHTLISDAAASRYPIEEDIPILLEERAQRM